MTQPIAAPANPVTPPTPAAALPTIPPEVQKFAEEVGVAPYLPGVLAMTRRNYPGREIAVTLVEDAVIENDWHIIFEVDDSGWTVEQMIEASRCWTRELFDNCPSTHTYYFNHISSVR